MKNTDQQFKSFFYFILQVSKSGIIESVLTWAKFKAQNQLQKSCSGKKQNKLKGVYIYLSKFIQSRPLISDLML